MAEQTNSPQHLTSEDKPKGILKHSVSLDDQRTVVHWDEMNILQTYHPEGKDYGHMKINEPPTPYNYRTDDSDVEDNTNLDPVQLAEKMKNVPDPEVRSSPAQEDDKSDSDDDVTQEQQEMKKAFEDKRKHHYNEYSNVKLARQLIEKELAELDDEDAQGS